MPYPQNSEATVGDADVQAQISDLRRETADRFSQVEKGMADLNAEVRVTKHDQANMKMAFDGHAARSERNQEALRVELKEVAGDFRSGVEALTEKINGINVKHEKGVSFFGGIAFIITAPIAVVTLILKLHFGG